MFNVKKTLVFCFIVSACMLGKSGAEEIVKDLKEFEDAEMASYENEVEIMDRLILVTEQNLINQKKIRNLMVDFKKQKDQFFKGDQTKSHSFKMVKTASGILSLIRDNYLQHMFSVDYLEELAMFSSIADKSRPVRP